MLKLNRDLKASQDRAIQLEQELSQKSLQPDAESQAQEFEQTLSKEKKIVNRLETQIAEMTSIVNKQKADHDSKVENLTHQIKQLQEKLVREKKTTSEKT